RPHPRRGEPARGRGLPARRPPAYRRRAAGRVRVGARRRRCVLRIGSDRREDRARVARGRIRRRGAVRGFMEQLDQRPGPAGGDRGGHVTTTVVWSDKLLEYDLGDHPLDPVRVELTMALARELGVLDRDGVSVVAPDPADDATLTLVHTAPYLA